ncbi:MAG TPA: hypothetical protein VFB95_09400 [Candidatus Cryosericum sp.]|nr:hypothetical protein [Candidatus Cryosericum sp.]
MRPRIRAGFVAALIAAIAGWLAPPSRAAETQFGYDGAVEQLYSQDIRRVGGSALEVDQDLDGYTTTVRLTAGLVVATPRSETSFRYTPAYIHYEDLEVTDPADPFEESHLDHRFTTLWRLRLTPLSEFMLRQGLSVTSRQSGFEDFAGAGGNASEPVIANTMRVVWDVAPSLSLTPSPDTTVTLDAIYREERYDRSTLIDSHQVGVQAAIERNVGRSQFVGARVRADAFEFSNPGATVVTAFDRFTGAEATWAIRVGERTSFQVGAGAYRSSGPQIQSVVRPTLDLTGNWSWRRVFLVLAYQLSYSTGGGISTSNRSQWGHVGISGVWGEGFEAGTDLNYIYRAAPAARLGDERPLGGWSAGVHISKHWLSGVGMFVRASDLQQERQVGPDLSYREGVIGVSFAPSAARIPEGPVRRPPPGVPGGVPARVP